MKKRGNTNRFAHLPLPPKGAPVAPKPVEEEHVPYHMEPTVESYSPKTWQPLIQIRPDPHITGVAASPTTTVAVERKPVRTTQHRWYRWLVVYLPCAVIGMLLLYVILELLLKHLAFRTLQQHMVNLPETPPPLRFVPPETPRTLPPGLTPLNLDALSLPRPVPKRIVGSVEDNRHISVKNCSLNRG